MLPWSVCLEKLCVSLVMCYCQLVTQSHVNVPGVTTGHASSTVRVVCTQLILLEKVHRT